MCSSLLVFLYMVSTMTICREGKREKMGWNRKNISEWREPSSGLGRGEGWQSLETCLWCHRSSLQQLSCQHIKFSSQMSAWVYYVASVKKHLNSAWSKSASKEIYLTLIANWRNTSFGEEKYRCFRGKCTGFKRWTTKLVPQEIQQVCSSHHNARWHSFLQCTKRNIVIGRVYIPWGKNVSV